MTSASLVTCSFSGDFDVCGLLCDSLDRFAPEGVQHLLYVPAHERAMFARFATPQRQILAQEDLLPAWFLKAPLPSPPWRRRLRLPRRNVYLTPYSWPVRGWIAQQIMKLSAALRAPTDIVAHLDSDMTLVRPLTLDHLIPHGKVRFHAEPVGAGLEAQKPWYEAGAKLLGLPPRDYSTTLYIDQFVVWRRDIVRLLMARIAETTGRDWRLALARTPQFAEYVLYGLFVDHVLGAQAAGVFATPRSLCHSRWTGALASPAEGDAFVAGLQKDHIAMMIQSTIPVPLHERARLIARAAA